MNKYYAVILKEDSQTIFAYDTVNEALSCLHHEIEYAINANVVTTCYVSDFNGKILKRDKHPSDLNNG